MKQVPRLMVGQLTGRIYIVTRYRVRENDVIRALEKHDITNDFMAVYEEATKKFKYTAPDGKTHG